MRSRNSKAQTNNFSADIGKGGAVVNVVTKRAPTRFHGSAFEFLRNSFMDAKNYFDDPTQPIPPFKRNEFGGRSEGRSFEIEPFWRLSGGESVPETFLSARNARRRGETSPIC